MEVLLEHGQSVMPKIDLLQAIMKAANVYDTFEIKESGLDMNDRNFQAEICLRGFRTFRFDVQYFGNQQEKHF